MSRRSSPTDKSKPTNKSTEMSTEKSTEKSTKILLKPHIESAPMKSTYQDELTTQCRVPMTTGCKLYSIELTDALHRNQTTLARLNLVSITILEKLTC
jgi:hypothetical protein